MSEKKAGVRVGQALAWVLILGTLSLVAAAVVAANVWAWTTIWGWL